MLFLLQTLAIHVFWVQEGVLSNGQNLVIGFSCVNQLKLLNPSFTPLPEDVKLHESVTVEY